MKKTMVELFANVGGFRLRMARLHSGWETCKRQALFTPWWQNHLTAHRETIWFSQWEPGKTKQWAHDCYVGHYGDLPDLNNEMTTGIDIGKFDKHIVPDYTLLVGGFSCQDYSVAHPLSSSQGIEGKRASSGGKSGTSLLLNARRSSC